MSSFWSRFGKRAESSVADPNLVISVQGLTRTFGKFTAVADVSLDVRSGEIFGILGPNGAGKSTTIRMLCGIIKPSRGQGTVVGIDLLRQPERVKQHVGYMTQRFSLYEDLTVRENLEFYAGIYNVPYRRRGEVLDQAIERAGLEAFRRRVTGELSGGWKQRVALACATLHQPSLLVLDEPTANVDPVSRRAFWSRIHAVAAGGTAVLLTTHYMDEAERCHRVAFVARGQLLDIGTPAELVARRGLEVTELVASDAKQAESALSGLAGVEDLVRYGDVLRVTTRGIQRPLDVVKALLESQAIGVLRAESRLAGVEDAFISMLSPQERVAMGGAT
ncbi:MAG TPA: ABC transporter ATP-binding protein [Polyangiaceae bacterium]|nr:ABC transporter ATP-binding protein [Polyangiaceae bacterium]